MLFVQNLGVQFQGIPLFEDVNFRVGKGHKIGLAGKNGAGKSTLLKILAGWQQSSSGDMSWEGEVSVGYLPQDLDFEGGKTVMEEVQSAFEHLNSLQIRIDEINHELTTRTDYESDSYSKLIEELTHKTEQFSLMGGYSTEADIQKVLTGLGFRQQDFDQLTDTFSGGWRMRLELAKLLLKNNDLLLLDEPTNHLDIDSIIWLEHFLKNYSGAVVLVSHDREFLDQITNRTLEIANKRVHDYKANYSKYLELRQERREQMEAAKKNQDQYIKHTEQLINKFRAKASKASTAQSLMKKLDRLEIIDIEQEDVHQMKIDFPVSHQPGKIIFELKDVAKNYGEKSVFSEVEFFINRGEKIAFVGQNGQGKSTLAKCMIGEIDYQGNIKPGHNIEIGYFAQDQSKVFSEDNTVLQEAEDASTEETRKRVRDLLGAFIFRNDDVEKKVKVLSGGERNRLALCKLLLNPSNVLVMDEPTNHLDMQSKKILKNALKNYEGTLILVSHDRDFLDGLVDKVFEFREGKVKEYLMGIRDYLKEREAEGFRQIEKVTAKKKEQNNSVKRNNKPDKKLANKVAKVEKEIAQLEREINKWKESFSKENPSTEDYEKFQKLEANLKLKMANWEELMLSIEG